MLTLLLVLNILMSIQTWLFPVLSLVFLFLFFLLASLAAARSGKVQTLLQLFLLFCCFSTLVLAVASACRAAASAAAAAACHACCVCSSLFFFVIHNADASSTDIDFHASGRSPQTLRICSGAYVVADASTEQE